MGKTKQMQKTALLKRNRKNEIIKPNVKKTKQKGGRVMEEQQRRGVVDMFSRFFNPKGNKQKQPEAPPPASLISDGKFWKTEQMVFNAQLTSATEQEFRMVSETEERNRFISDFLTGSDQNRFVDCKKVLNMPDLQADNWYFSIYMILFYSQGMRKMMMKKALSWQSPKTGAKEDQYLAEFYEFMKNVLLSVFGKDTPGQASKIQHMFRNKLLPGSFGNYIKMINPNLSNPGHDSSWTSSILYYLTSLFNILKISYVHLFDQPSPNKSNRRSIYISPIDPVSGFQQDNPRYIQERYQKLMNDGFDVILMDNMGGFSEDSQRKIKNSVELMEKSASLDRISVDLNQDEIIQGELGKESYVKDALLFHSIGNASKILGANFSTIAEEKLPLGLTCQNESYMYNRFVVRVSKQRSNLSSKQSLSRDMLPCEMDLFDWKTEINNPQGMKYELQRNKCDLGISYSTDNIISQTFYQDHPRTFFFINKKYDDLRESNVNAFGNPKKRLDNAIRDANNVYDIINRNAPTVPFDTVVLPSTGLTSRGINSLSSVNKITTTDIANSTAYATTPSQMLSRSITSNTETNTNTNDSMLKLLKSKASILDDIELSKQNLMCIRRASNFSHLESEYKFDHVSFKPDKFMKDLPSVSPKMNKLIEQIRMLDQRDQMQEKRTYKHFIFSELDYGYGAKMITSALLASKVASDIFYDKKFNWKPGQNRVAYVGKERVFESEITPKRKTQIINEFNGVDQDGNRTRGNVYGENLRFLVVDRSFKEGVDLFDVKYVHIFEPTRTDTERTQIIGRSTRYCGQKNLNFRPNIGWPLDVFIYDTILQSEDHALSSILQAQTLHQLFQERSDINMEMQHFAKELQKMAIQVSVDYTLNKNIHEIAINNKIRKPLPDDPYNKYFGINVARQIGGIVPYNMRKSQHSNTSSKASSKASSKSKSKHDCNRQTGGRTAENVLLTQAIKDSETELKDFKLIKPFNADNNLDAFVRYRQYIMDNFNSGRYKWPPVTTINNLCTQNSRELTPSQEFLRHYLASFLLSENTRGKKIEYFKNGIYPNGMLIYHTVGTGKTCTAVAAATSYFQSKGYKIIWVTRSSISSSPYKKDMYDGALCHMDVRRDKKSTENKIPVKEEDRKKKYENNWMQSQGSGGISYRQFTNLLKQENQALYKEIIERDAVKKNNNKDPLAKTFVIIDEAHKLYEDDPQMPAAEKPDVDSMYKHIMNSYDVSGKDSIKLFLMTATPYTDDPMEMIKLLNLLLPKKMAMPTKFQDFKNKYLITDGDNKGKFREDKKVDFFNLLAGKISYLTREYDPRAFAQPEIHSVLAPLSTRITRQKEGISEFSVGYVRLHIADAKKVRNELVSEQEKHLHRMPSESSNEYQEWLEMKEQIEELLEKNARLIEALEQQEKNTKDKVKNANKNNEKDLSQEKKLLDCFNTKYLKMGR